MRTLKLISLYMALKHKGEIGWRNVRIRYDISPKTAKLYRYKVRYKLLDFSLFPDYEQTKHLIPEIEKMCE